MDSYANTPEESKKIAPVGKTIPPPYKATPKKLFDKKPQGFLDEDIKQQFEEQQSQWEQLGDAQLTLEGVQEYRDGCAMVYEAHKSDTQFMAAVEACHQSSFTIPKKYGNDASVRVLVHRPKSLPSKNNAAIIFAHGGGAIGGSPEQNIPIVSYLANQSQVVAFNIQYRLAPQAKYYQMISDMYVVVKHVYENCEELGINPKQIAIQGQSGGGYLCMGTAAMLAVKNQSGMVKLMIVGQPISNDYYLTEKKQNMTKLAAMAFYDGPFVPKHIATDLDKQLKERDPILFPGIAKDQVMAKYPPAYIFESEYDNFIEPTWRFAQRMRKLGRLNEYVNYPGAQHGFYGTLKYKRSTEYWNDYRIMIKQYLKN